MARFSLMMLPEERRASCLQISRYCVRMDRGESAMQATTYTYLDIRIGWLACLLAYLLAVLYVRSGGSPVRLGWLARGARAPQHLAASPPSHRAVTALERRRSGGR